MLPDNISRRLARLQQVYQNYDGKSAEQVFKIDESSFYAWNADRSRDKALLQGNARLNLVALECSSNADHMKFIPVVSAYGWDSNPVIVLKGK